MAPPNEETFNSKYSFGNVFDLSDSKFYVKGFPLLTQVPHNVSFTPFSSKSHSSDAPPSILQRVLADSHRGGFLGFSHSQPSDRLMNSLGSFSDRNFLSIFRFKTWWSTQWVGTSGSHLQMETQWVLLHSGSTKVKASSFDSIAYVHFSENPYTLMKEAFSALRVHLNTFKLLEEKNLPTLVDKFGWCTWDAFYLTVQPIGIWHGLKDFADAGVPPRFLIIDDGWQSINLDGGEDAKNLILCGDQMNARLHRLDECGKFRRYKSGQFLGPNPPPFDPNNAKLLIEKGIELERLERDSEAAKNTQSSELVLIESKIQTGKGEIDVLFGGGEQIEKKDCGSSCSCKGEEEYGMKAFTKDLRTKFKGLDNIYAWHAHCGAWGGVRPGATHLNSKFAPCKLSPGLDGTMHDLAVVRIVEGSIGLVHPDQANDFYDSMHSYLAQSGVTGVKVDVIHCLEYVSDEYGGRVELAKAYYDGLTNSMEFQWKWTHC
ncbi:Tethering factor for nuclear proteasome sts1 [Stylosanthes scabra]|uniref:Tethering factor for nuclear proteasome sts1 n=1 Tax=Stylosanthes scabra TaxID=79078 RepID=A0ABU6V6K2_9FABA|nr:Tethering factor for nuclear proteasome sts1 [Stylosanthes scabra]